MKTSFYIDEYWMQSALDLAVLGEGLTRPNPPVGAVVVNNNEMVGGGFHPKAGEPHAEIFALKQAGSLAKDATIYVTLEPCCTHGRTPPCTDAIINAGIKRVVYGCVDPNPKHAGRADAILIKAGIKISRGVLGESCRTLIRPFATRILKKRPMVTLKLACSMDGRIADENGDSKWITGAPARDAVQDLRRAVDGIMIGAETLRSDNPSLLPRPANGRNPWRIVIAGKNPLPVKSKLFNDASRHRTIVFASGKFGQRREMEKRGVSVCEVASSRGHISMKAVLRELAKLDCMHVVCEGGGVLAQALLREKVVDQMWMFYAPILLGDGAVPSVAGRGWKLKNAPGFMMKHVERLGNDVLLVLERD